MLSAELPCAFVAPYHQSQSFVMEKLDKAMDHTFANVANVRVFGQEPSDGASAQSVACQGVGQTRVEGRRRDRGCVDTYK